MGSCCARGCPREGSTRGAIFNIASATLGAGALGLPYAFKQSGYLLTLVWLLVAACSTVYSIKLLLIASRVATDQCRFIVDSYEDLAGAVFGNRMRHIVEVMMILFCFGTAVAYCVAVGDILEPVRKLEWMPSLVRSDTYGRMVVMVAFWGTFMFPLSLLKSVSSLQFSSFLGVAAIGILVIATIYHCVQHRVIDEWDCLDTGGPKCTAPLDMARFDLDMISSLPLIMFAFTCQVNVYDIYRELTSPSVAKMIRISWFGMLGICLAVYASIGLFGYLDFKNTIRGNILLNLTYQVGHDVIVTGAFACITITVIVAFPLVVFPCRESIFSIVRAPPSSSDRDRMIEQYRTGRPEYQQQYVVGPGARREASRQNSPTASPRLMQSFPLAPEDSLRPRAYSVDLHIQEVDETETPVPHTLSAPNLILPSYPVTAEGYYVPPVPTRVYTRPPAWQHYLVSSGIAIGAILVAIVVPQIQVVFSLLGGICSSFLCFVFPAMCVKRLGCRSKVTAGVVGIIAIEALLWGGTAAGVFSTALTVYNLFQT